MSAAPPLVLLLDDAGTFRAAEGTCLRRHRCRLLKAPVDRLADAARHHRPALVLASCPDAAVRRRVLEACADRALARIPVLLVDLVAGRPGSAPRPPEAAPRRAPVEVVGARRRRSGQPDYQDLDARLDEAIRRLVPALSPRGERLAVSLPVRCTGIGKASLLRTKDISDSGLFLKTSAPLPAGRRFAVSLRLGPRESVSGLCEVVRGVKPGSAGHEDQDLIAGVGVRFVELADDGRAVLRRYVTAGGRAGTRAVRRTARAH